MRSNEKNINRIISFLKNLGNTQNVSCLNAEEYKDCSANNLIFFCRNCNYKFINNTKKINGNINKRNLCRKCSIKSKKHNHTWDLLISNLHAGKWCKLCGYEKAREKQKINFINGKLLGLSKGEPFRFKKRKS